MYVSHDDKHNLDLRSVSIPIRNNTFPVPPMAPTYQSFHDVFDSALSLLQNHTYSLPKICTTVYLTNIKNRN